MNLSSSRRLRILRDWTGGGLLANTEPPRRHPMKVAFLILLAAVLALFALGMSSCATVTTKTTVTDPATGLVTVTETTTTAPDGAAVTALSTTAQAFAPRAVIVHPAK